MKMYIVRKILVVLIMVLPLISWSGCKKQAKCGCGKDVLFSLKDELLDHSAITFGANGASASFSIGYSTYIFCNPIEMYALYSAMNKDDQMILSGDAFWECSYLMQSGSGGSSYYYYYKVYNIEVTKLEPYLYGKK
jgi:hypothetical protein